MRRSRESGSMGYVAVAESPREMTEAIMYNASAWIALRTRASMSNYAICELCSLAHLSWFFEIISYYYCSLNLL